MPFFISTEHDILLSEIYSLVLNHLSHFFPIYCAVTVPFLTTVSHPDCMKSVVLYDLHFQFDGGRIAVFKDSDVVWKTIYIKRDDN